MSHAAAGAFKPPTADDPVLVEVVRRLVEAYHPVRIYLFGSSARGDAGADSDYDLLVLLPDGAPKGLLDGKLAHLALGGLGIAKDVLVWTSADFQRRLHLRASLPSTVIREGKVLYGD